MVSKSGSSFQGMLMSFCLLVLSLMNFYLFLVLFTMLYVVLSKQVAQYLHPGKEQAETLVFLFSSLTLIFMGFPSMKLLYSFSSQTSPMIIVKITASQWYWNFEFSDLMDEAIPMYMMPLEDMDLGGSRLLEVDNRLVLPCNMLIQFNITSSDVIHSFALPSLGAKVDATSGLLTVVPIFTSKVGLHYGQCSEICGMNHSFMPICLEVTTFNCFFWWLQSIIL